MSFNENFVLFLPNKRPPPARMLILPDFFLTLNLIYSIQNKAHKSTLISYENQLNAAHEQTEQFSIDLESKERDLQDLQEQLSTVQNKLRDEIQKVYNE